MTRLFLYLLLAAVLLFGCQTGSKKPAHAVQRVISLSPHITEVIYALGQQDKLAAVTDFCKYPPQAARKPKIGGLLNPNLERIITLRPDLLIGTPAHEELRQKLKAEGLPCLLIPNDRLSDVFTTIDTIGAVLNCRNRARQLVRQIKDSLNAYARLSAGKISEPIRAMLVIGRDAPELKNITVAGSETFLSEVWQLVGGQNAFADLPVKYATVNPEAIQTHNPDCIIEFKFGQKWDEKKDRENRKQWSKFAMLSAVQKKRIFVFTGDYTLIPGPRIFKLARDYSRIVKRFNMEK